MKIAISTDSGKVAAHFGRCPEFTIAEIDESDIKNKKIIENPGHKPGYLPQFMNDRGVDCMISEGMGRKAASLFDKYGIKTITGVNGEVDEILHKLLNDSIESSSNPCKPGKGKGYGIEKEDKHE